MSSVIFQNTRSQTLSSGVTPVKGTDNSDAIRFLVEKFMDDMDYVSTGVEPLNVELEACMVDFMISNGLECEQLNKTLHLAASFIELCYPGITSIETKLNVALFNWLLIYIDDQASKSLSSLLNFQKHILSGQGQVEPIMEVLTRVLHDLWSFYDPLCFNLIIGSTLSFLTSSFVECSLDAIPLVSNVTRFAWFMREGTGIAKSFATFPFTKSNGFQGLDFIQGIPDMEYWIDITNDILSFYKEDLAGETVNYVNIRARNENKTALEVLAELIEEAVAASQTVYTTLAHNPDALKAWKAYERGYINWHLTQDRYKLSELLSIH